MKEKGAKILKIFASELQYRLVEFKCLQSPKERSSVLITKTQSENSFYHVHEAKSLKSSLPL